MASKHQVESWTEEAMCPICLDFFTDPVALECGHNFCRSCITRFWDRAERNSCPECGAVFEERTLRVSWALARLAEKARNHSLYRKEERKPHCEEHQEELKLFCETDKKLICVICAATREHKSHSFMVIGEAVELYKNQVKSSIESLAKKESEIQLMEQQQKLKISGVRDESRNLKSHFKAWFVKLHQILSEKENRLLRDLQEEKMKIVNEMKIKLTQIENNLNDVQRELVELKERMDQKDSVLFLQDEVGRKSRASVVTESLPVTDAVPAFETFHHPFVFSTMITEISDAIKRSSLRTDVSVTLDVETAHPRLEVSEDRKRVRGIRTERSLPDTGKRFTDSPCVLGSEGFTAGRHYWEVEVAGSQWWSLGVAAESVERKRRVALTPENGVWSIWRGWGDVFNAFTSPPSPLPARPIPGRVGVYLSYESGTVSFYDADTKSHLHTFTGNKFTEKLYPYFATCHENQWLRICSGSAPGV
ncbi:zinc-binding protein A33-like [Leucoraja erinacea]|uniref:zinc-binding protein A33-like n=1 Tax=Leucoraja erinaceus TaxID=7782 RepID=UPI00245616D6|nr:zinc-binding protein A33-like [Leucoraja erinacea]